MVESSCIYMVKGKLPLVIPHESTPDPGDHTLHIRLTTTSETITNIISYTDPKEREKREVAFQSEGNSSNNTQLTHTYS